VYVIVALHVDQSVPSSISVQSGELNNPGPSLEKATVPCGHPLLPETVLWTLAVSVTGSPGQTDVSGSPASVISVASAAKPVNAIPKHVKRESSTIKPRLMLNE
jgi:hypothetical protein